MTLFSSLTSEIVTAFSILTIAIFLFGNMTLGNSQPLSNQQPVNQQEQDSTFQSRSDKFNITVPDGWVVQEVRSTDTDTLLREIMKGSRLLAQLCPQDQAIADIEGNYSCEESKDSIYIQEYPNLADEPDFASIADSNIGNDDLIDYHIMKLQNLGYSEISILHNTNMTINVINTDANKTIAAVPANLVEMRYNSLNSTETRGYFLLTATNATSDLGLMSGYILSYETNAATSASLIPAEPILRIFQSFQFVDEAREAALSELDLENDDYESDRFNSTGKSTTSLEDLLSLPPGLTEQTNTTNSTS
jgi:hypothetical protein